MTQVKNTISDMLVKKFGQWKYVLVVYRLTDISSSDISPSDISS